jgi:hypothetical protein
MLFILDFFNNYGGDTDKLKNEFFMNDAGLIENFNCFKTPDLYENKNEKLLETINNLYIKCFD